MVSFCLSVKWRWGKLFCGSGDQLKPIAILLGSTQASIEDLVRTALAPGHEFEFRGRAASSAQIISRCGSHAPDLILLDVDLADLSLISLIRLVRYRHPMTRIIGFSASEDVKTIREMLEAGAQGYLLSSDALHDLPDALHAALAGGSVFSARVTQLLLHSR
jgi:DNA-binding NarL/FixJ family response regulator